MFQPMRRSDRQLNQAETEEILRTAPYGVLAMAGENGYPYGVPISYAYQNGKIYFHGALNAGAKAADLARCDKVCFTVVGQVEPLPAKFSTKYESVIVFGTARLCADEEKAQGLKYLQEKYSADFEEAGVKYIQAAQAKTAVYEITIDHMTGKARK